MAYKWFIAAVIATTVSSAAIADVPACPNPTQTADTNGNQVWMCYDGTKVWEWTGQGIPMPQIADDTANVVVPAPSPGH